MFQLEIVNCQLFGFNNSMKITNEREELATAGRLHWFHWGAVLLSLAVTIGAWLLAKKQLDEKIQAQFVRESDHVVELIYERMQKYEDGLWAGASAIQASGGDISFDKWKKFANTQRIDLKYPGINGIGVIFRIFPENVDAFLQRRRVQDPDFHIHPEHKENEFWPIAYIEPVEPNRQAVGLDMAHEENRFTAAKKACDSADAQITGPIVLVQDSEKTAGFLFYVPFYKDKIDESVEIRRRNFVGLVYAPFVMKKLMKGALEREKRHVGIRINDGDEVIYDEHIDTEFDYDKNPLFRKSYDVDLYGRNWNIDIRSTKAFRAATRSHQPYLILVGGIIIDSLLLALFVTMAKSNKTALDFADRMSSGYQQKARDLEKTNERLVVEVKERQEAEALAAQYSQAKSDFLANMSHEIRTPMNAVVGMTDLVLDSELTPLQRDYLTTVKSASKSLLLLINDILDFSKIEARKFNIEAIPFDFRDCIGDVFGTLGPTAHEKRIELIYRVADDVPGVLVGDPRRIRQVIINLVGNAIKFTAIGEVFVNVERSESQPMVTGQPVGEACTLQVSIADTGIGIPPDGQERIFEPFSQLDGSTTRKFGGTGLGTSISAQLVAMMHGKIWLQSPSNNTGIGGAGSTFFFTVETTVGPPSSVKPMRISEALRMTSVLIVDDNNTVREMLKEMLESWGMIADTAANGKDAIQRMKEKAEQRSPFRLVIIDSEIPDLGENLLNEEIKQTSGPSCGIVTTLSTAGAGGEHTRYNAPRASAYVIKPIQPRSLLAAIQTALDFHGHNQSVSTKLLAKEVHQETDHSNQLRFLLAEDTVFNQKLATALLEKRGHQVVVVGDGQKALDILENEQFDAVLMDVQMPNMDGYEATASMRKREQACGGPRIPIIAMTAHAMKGDQERCLRAGMDAYVPKPIDPGVLFGVIDKIFPADARKSTSDCI